MDETLYFYDLETSGFNPRQARVMQFAGQRTTLDLKPVGEPHNVLIKMSADVLPEPDAILVTGITPQQTTKEGLSEAQFLELFTKEVATAGTIFVGFNNVRFDDEFLRFLHYRNFYDPYEWQWADGRSRWDLLDLVRMTRALRPSSMKWPVDSDGKQTNRLELLSSINKINHSNAHDALSDVQATIALAQLILKNEPKLFKYLLGMRDKQRINALVHNGQPFVYTSGKYPSEFEKTTVVATVLDHPKRPAVLVYDLRHDPDDYVHLNPEQLAAAWQNYKDDSAPKLPIKTLQYNRCPAIAPLSVLDKASQKRLSIDLKKIDENYKKLNKHSAWTAQLSKALEILDKKQQAKLFNSTSNVDSQLYDGFLSKQDKKILPEIRQAKPDDLAKAISKVKDNRLKELLPLYKARNFSDFLSTSERKVWDKHCQQKLMSSEPGGLEYFFSRLSELRNQPSLTKQQKYLIEELQIYGESLLPDDVS